MVITLYDLSLGVRLSQAVAICACKRALDYMGESDESAERARRLLSTLEAICLDHALPKIVPYEFYDECFPDGTCFPGVVDDDVVMSMIYYSSCTSGSGYLCSVINIMFGIIDSDEEDYMIRYHKFFLELMPMILRFKIEAGNCSGFKSPDKIFEFLSKEDKELFIYNMDLLI